MWYPYPVMRKGLCYFSRKKHFKKARFKKAFAREMARVRKVVMPVQTPTIKDDCFIQ